MDKFLQKIFYIKNYQQIFKFVKKFVIIQNFQQASPTTPQIGNAQ